ncbi:hypothetical protein BKA82DRAFT_4018553 [Pisolithus tinctorius]|nr:hypothetical protein BKA82DRAFT_4018553 [Pisolithus tinctorius]
MMQVTSTWVQQEEGVIVGAFEKKMGGDGEADINSGKNSTCEGATDDDDPHSEQNGGAIRCTKIVATLPYFAFLELSEVGTPAEEKLGSPPNGSGHSSNSSTACFAKSCLLSAALQILIDRSSKDGWVVSSKDLEFGCLVTDSEDCLHDLNIDGTLPMSQLLLIPTFLSSILCIVQKELLSFCFMGLAPLNKIIDYLPDTHVGYDSCAFFVVMHWEFVSSVLGHANWADSEWAFYGPRMELLNPSHNFTAFDGYGHLRKDDTIPVLLVMQAAQADVFDVSIPFFNPVTVFKTPTLLVPPSLHTTKTCRQGTCDAGANRIIVEDLLPEEASGVHRNCMEAG